MLTPQRALVVFEGDVKKIAVGDLGEFWYGDYKEPFVQLEGAVEGYPQGVVLKDDDGRLLCAYCGEAKHQLGNHARIKHGLRARDYKAEVGLLQKTALVSEPMRVQMSAMAVRKLGNLRARGLAVPRRTGKEPALKGGRQPLERYNKGGRCYAQLLAVGRSVLAEHGRVTAKLLAKRGIWEWSVKVYFADLNAFYAAIGAPSHSQVRWTREDLLAALRNTGQTLGRAPSKSDLRRYGLPSPPTFTKHFGSYVEACISAGLDPNLPPPLTSEREAHILSAYSTTGSISKVTRIVRCNQSTVQQTLARYGVPVFPGGNGWVRDRAEARAFAGEVSRRLTGWEAEAAA